MANQFGHNLSTIGSYRLLKLIGFGPISRLYLAQREAGSPEPLALKLIETSPRIFQQEHRHIFFSREVDRFMCLKHRSLLPLQDASIHEGYPYLVYPYIKSGSLADYLAFHQTPKLLLDEALALIYQLGKALEAAHQAQIIHGNLKPSNIFLVAKGIQTLADLRLTRSVAALADFTLEALTRGMRTTRLRSTIAARYMAPEQFWGALTAWSDQYSLACLAYELLVGKPVFPARDFHTLEKMHAHQNPTPPSQLVHNLPQEIEVALLKALSKRVGDRYPNIQAFLTALAAHSMAYDSAPTPHPGPAHSPETGPIVISANKLVLPLLTNKEEPIADADQVTQSTEAIHISHAIKVTRKRQQAQDSRWLWLVEQVKTLCYYALVFYSLLIMWCGELWSIILLLFLALRNRGQLWQKMRETSARIPAVHSRAPTSLWQTMLVSSWHQGIARNRRRWRRVFNPTHPRRRNLRRLTLLIVGSL